jgi:serine protease Do
MTSRNQYKTKFRTRDCSSETFARRMALFPFLQALFPGVLCLFVLSGCMGPKVVVTKDDTAFKEYKRVYLLVSEKDPRNVYPIVANKLGELGFAVKQVKKGDSIEGGQGSGFVVSPEGHILTAAHVLDKLSDATVWVQGNRIETEVICSDKEKDLALLKPKTALKGPMEYLQLDFDSLAKMGQDVYTIGFPLSGMLGRSPRLTKGLISSTVGMKDSPDHLQVSVEIQPGNSGSPLLDTDGHVIGVLQSTLNPLAVLQRSGGTLPQNVNFAAKAHVVKAFFDTCTTKIPLADKKAVPKSFDTVKSAVAQIYSGIISDEFVTQPKMVSTVTYQYYWDLWYRFRVLHLEFYDYDTGALLMTAGQYHVNFKDTEMMVIDNTFDKIRDTMFMQQNTVKEDPKKIQ